MTPIRFNSRTLRALRSSTAIWSIIASYLLAIFGLTLIVLHMCLLLACDFLFSINVYFLPGGKFNSKYVFLFFSAKVDGKRRHCLSVAVVVCVTITAPPLHGIIYLALLHV